MTIKKITLAIFALSSGAVFAGTMGPACVEGNVTVPCVSSAWGFGVQALYLKPTFSGDLAWSGNTVIGDINNEVVSNQITLNQNNLKWQASFKLEAAYHFNTGNDLNLNWYHMGRQSTNRPGDIKQITTEAGLITNQVLGDANTFKPSWDAVNIEFAQDVNFGYRKNIRFYGGMQYVRIGLEHTVSTSTTSLEPGTVLSDLADESWSYNGVGPRVGADMSYGFANNFGVFANSAAALLTGKSKDNKRFSDNTGNSSTIIASKTAVVPELEAALGLNYSHALAKGVLTVDAGYMWVNYFSSLVVASFDTDANFSVQGPFVGLRWLSNM
jgi:hypothetical protein